MLKLSKPIAKLGLVVCWFLSSCGQESLVTCDESLAEADQSANCVKKTADERAVIFLNSENFTGAIEVLEEAMAEDAAAGIAPKYVRYVRLAAAYAGNANCSFLDLLNTLTSSGNNEDIDCESGVTYSDANVLGEIDKISSLNRSINLIDSIPDDILNPTNPELQEFYVNSAKLQSSLYIPVHTNKCLKLFEFVYADQSQRGQYINDDRLSATGCQPSDIADNLLQAALDIVATVGCGDAVSQEVCDEQQALIREQANDISIRSTVGDSSNEISNLMVSLCQEENPDAECPELVLE